MVSPPYECLSAILLAEGSFGQPNRPVPLAVGLHVTGGILTLIYETEQLYSLCEGETRAGGGGITTSVTVL